jgi:hypothetical protein
VPGVIQLSQIYQSRAPRRNRNARSEEEHPQAFLRLLHSPHLQTMVYSPIFMLPTSAVFLEYPSCAKKISSGPKKKQQVIQHVAVQEDFHRSRSWVWRDKTCIK